MTAPTIPLGYSLGRPSFDIEDELLALAEIHDVATLGALDDGIDYIRECIASPCTSPERDGWIVRDSQGVLVAWAFISNPHGEQREYGDFYLHPAAVSQLYQPLLRLVLQRSAERASEDGHPHHDLGVGTLSSQVVEEAELRRAGFTTSHASVRMRRDLDGSEGQLPVPEGVTLDQGVDRTDDAVMRSFHYVGVEAFRTPETKSDRTYESWLAALDAAPSTPYDEWILARVDGEPVGMMKSEADLGGWVDLLGVIPEHQGRGIGRLMLDRAFATFWAKGRTYAELGLSNLNTNARGVYEAAGMYMRFEQNVWRRDVPAQAPVAER